MAAMSIFTILMCETYVLSRWTVIFGVQILSSVPIMQFNFVHVLFMNTEHLERVRQFCLALPDTSEKISHGEPTFFVGKKVFVMFANNHHNDRHIAVWLPVQSGFQETLINAEPEKFFNPPFVGIRGWVGIELNRVSDEELATYVQEAWHLIAPKKLHGRF